MSTQEIRIEALKKELEYLKAKQRNDVRAANHDRKWKSAKNPPARLPDWGTIRVIAWHENTMDPCWYSEENKKWWAYNGTWMSWPEDEIKGVTHWIRVDWLSSHSEWPLYGPGVMNRLRYHWRRFTRGASDIAYRNMPKAWGRKAQLDKKVVFYRDHRGKVVTGMPENVPAPFGMQKIVCNSALEAERYSEMQRRQERSEHSRFMEERGSVENAMLDQIRSDRRTLMANARNNVNREFLRRSFERSDGRPEPWKYERESYLHCEGYEKNR